MDDQGGAVERRRQGFHANTGAARQAAMIGTDGQRQPVQVERDPAPRGSGERRRIRPVRVQQAPHAAGPRRVGDRAADNAAVRPREQPV
jgi:hypothetical protein